MSHKKFTRLVSKTVILPQENIDTDQIIPARFLTTTSRGGLGRAAFYDWRFDADGQAKATNPFAKFEPESHQILVAGANFGCGSSREHAPWALFNYGFRAVISTKIADIFKSNALKNGIVPIEIPAQRHNDLMGRVAAELIIDLEHCKIELPGHWTESFLIDPFGRRCLLDGVDPLDFLQAREADISKFEARAL